MCVAGRWCVHILLMFLNNFTVHHMEKCCVCHFQPPPRPHPGPSLCPRFLAHMKARPEDLRPPCFLSSRPRPQPPSQARTTSTHVLAAPRTQMLEGGWGLSTAHLVLFTPSQPQQEEGAGSFHSTAPLINKYSRLFFLSWRKVEVEATGFVVSS